MTLNCFKCNQEVVFDAEHIGRNGKKIPLDPETHTPHKCPVDQQEKNDHGNENASPWLREVKSIEEPNYVDHTQQAKGQSKVKMFVGGPIETMEDAYNKFLQENNGKIKTQGAQFQMDNGKFAIALYYEETK